MIGRCSQQTLCIQGDEVQGGIVSGPHAHRAGAGGLGGVEHALTPKQDVVERVGLAIAGVAKDGEDLDPSDVRTAEPLHKLSVIFHLEEERRDEGESCVCEVEA